MFFRIMAHTLALSALLLMYGCVAAPSSVNPSTVDSVTPSERPDVLTLSGHVGVSGVRLQGVPNTVTDSNGVYHAEVPYGWSGTLRPKKEGYRFSPTQRSFTHMEDSQAGQDFMAEPITHTLAGSIGIDDVKLTGLPGSARTGQNGCYSVDLRYGWSGTVTPQKEGWVFSPESVHYHKITEDMLHEDFQARPVEYTISGAVDKAGVHMTGLPGRVLTDEQGLYQAEVPHGWSARVTPKQMDTEFEPSFRDYTDVNSGYAQQDYSVETPGTQTNADYADEVLTFQTGNCPVKSESLIEDTDSPTHTEKDPVDEPMSWRLWRPRLISTSKLAPDVYVELEQDLHVMAALLEKTVYGNTLVRREHTGRIQALFLEDCCALFTIPIDWRLSDLEPRETTSSSAVDATTESLWEQTRREILRSRQGDDVVDRLGYQKTRQFKQQLVEALSYATNIRHLSNDQWITLFVWSHRPAKNLVLRVKKETVDQYARGQYSSEEFARRVSSWMY